MGVSGVDFGAAVWGSDEIKKILEASFAHAHNAIAAVSDADLDKIIAVMVADNAQPAAITKTMLAFRTAAVNPFVAFDTGGFCDGDRENYRIMREHQGVE